MTVVRSLAILAAAAVAIRYGSRYARIVRARRADKPACPLTAAERNAFTRIRMNKHQTAPEPRQEDRWFPWS